MVIFQFRWGDNKDPSEETRIDQSNSLTPGSIDSLESILNILGVMAAIRITWIIAKRDVTGGLGMDIY